VVVVVVIINHLEAEFQAKEILAAEVFQMVAEAVVVKVQQVVVTAVALD
jgi:hypothetical protein